MDVSIQDMDIVELIKEAENGDDLAVENLLIAAAMCEELSCNNQDFWKIMHGYYKRMASRGYGNAFIYLAGDYRTGTGGVAKNIWKAKEYYELAIGHGCRAGYEFLAGLYVTGDTLDINYKKAYKLLMKSMYCEGSIVGLSSDMGKYLLAEFYFRGLYVSRNLSNAEEYYRNVIAIGSDYDASFYWRAQYRLGQIYELKGDEKNAQKHKGIAREYYNRDEEWDENKIEDLLIDYI